LSVWVSISCRAIPGSHQIASPLRNPMAYDASTGILSKCPNIVSFPS